MGDHLSAFMHFKRFNGQVIGFVLHAPGDMEGLDLFLKRNDLDEYGILVIG